MKQYLVCRNGRWSCENRTNAPKDIPCYRVSGNKDLSTETKCADEVNRIEKEKYELRKQN